MTSPQVTTVTTPPRPVAIEQIRILTWFQFHLTVVTLIVVTIAGAVLSGQGDWAFLMYRDDARRGTDTMLMVMLVLAGTAFLLGFAAFALRRAWAVSLPLVALAEVAVVAGASLTTWAGLESRSVLGVLTMLIAAALGLLSVLLLGLGGWIVARLSRGEVWRWWRR
jgi:hypothetical protein